MNNISNYNNNYNINNNFKKKISHQFKTERIQSLTNTNTI